MERRPGQLMSTELYRTGLDEDLRPISALLWQQRIAHRIVEEGGAQVVWLQAPDDAEKAHRLLDQWKSGELRISVVRSDSAAPRSTGLFAALGRVPVTTGLIALSIVGFVLMYVGVIEVLKLMTYQPFEWVRGRPVFGEATGQFWRLVTPVFLHFGWMHIVFNCLWCWELGRRIEYRLGSLNLLGLFLVTAAVSNTAQHQWSGPVFFGGLSGVVYGLLGFAWMAGRVNPRWRELVPATPVMLFMVGWLLICVFGVIDVLGFSVANAAHVAGLLCGLVLGALFALLHRPRES